MNFEQLRRRPLRTAGLAIAVGFATLTLAACGHDGDATPPPRPAATETISSPGVEQIYYDDGSRLTTYNRESSSEYADEYANVWAYCDGTDLVEQTAYNGGYRAAAGNDISRSVDHPACADGTLTADDFKTVG